MVSTRTHSAFRSICRLEVALAGAEKAKILSKGSADNPTNPETVKR
jgi:hypothetical protein